MSNWFRKGLCLMLMVAMVLTCATVIAEERVSIGFVRNEEQVIFDENGVKMSLTGEVEDDGMMFIVLEAIIENSTTNSIYIVQEGTANGWAAAAVFNGVVIPAGAKAKSRLIVNYEACNIKSFRELESLDLWYEICDSATNESIFTTDSILITFDSASDHFTFRNGITFHATQEDIMTLESLPFKSQNSSDVSPWIKFGGKIAGIDHSVIYYCFDPSTKELCDVMFVFDGTGYLDLPTLNSYYEDILASVSRQYGEPLSQSDTGAGSVVGKAHENYQELSDLFSQQGNKATVKNDKEWVLEYDGYNVKIDLLAYYMDSQSGNTYCSLMMGYRRYNAESTAAEPSTIDSDL